jgi:peptidoglycan/xylan/chitin deacetylase (PgdA/CDA1 family)
MAAARGLQTVQWSVDPRDWDTPGTAAIVARVDQNVRPDRIVLLHDGGGNRSQTVAALKAILDHLDASGLPVVAICAPPSEPPAPDTVVAATSGVPQGM